MECRIDNGFVVSTIEQARRIGLSTLRLRYAITLERLTTLPAAKDVEGIPLSKALERIDNKIKKIVEQQKPNGAVDVESSDDGKSESESSEPLMDVAPSSWVSFSANFAFVNLLCVILVRTVLTLTFTQRKLLTAKETRLGRRTNPRSPASGLRLLQRRMRGVQLRSLESSKKMMMRRATSSLIIVIELVVGT